MEEPSKSDQTPRRNFLSQHVALAKGLGYGFFFAAAIGAIIGIWFSNGDMIIVIPALGVGFFFAMIGWLLVPDFSRSTKTMWILFCALFFAALGRGIYIHFHSPASSIPPAVASNDCDSISQSAPNWLQIAAKECGQKELRWPQENPRINDYFSSLRDGKHHRQDVENDPASDWSSPFVEWSLNKVGKSGPRNVDPLTWLKWGKKIDTPVLGAIVVLNLGGLHHVGFVFRDDGDRIEVLGGNEHDMVAISDYAKSEVLGYRLPAEAPSLNINGLMDAEIPNFAGDTREKIKLSHGTFRRGSDSIVLETKASSYAVGDFDNSGRQDIVATIGASGGGSGYFTYLALFTDDDGILRYLTSKELGDRVVIKKVSYANGVFKIEMIGQGGNDALCCPTHRKVVLLRLKNGSFAEARD